MKQRRWVVWQLACLLVALGGAGCITRASGDAEPTVAVASSADSMDAGSWLIAPSLLAMEQTVAETCSAGITTAPIAASNAEVEQALTGAGPADASTQPIGAMTRRFYPNAVCNTKVGSPQNAASIAVGRDAVDIASRSAAGCSLAYSGPASADAGGKTISTSAGPYTIVNWKDVLRILFAGVDHDGNKDCNSPVRRALVSNWNNLFETACGSGCPNGLRHVFRPGDKSDTVEWFLGYLFLPPLSADSFCNGAGAAPGAPGDADFLDNDPIRIPCSGPGTTAADVDHVCNAGPAGGSDAGAGDAGGAPTGDLGLVLSLAVPQPQLPAGVDAGSVLYPTVACTPGSFGLVSQPAGVPCIVNGPPGQCIAPFAGTNNFACHNDVSNVPVGTNIDGRAFNLQVRLPDGTLAADRSGRPLAGAFYRLRAGNSSGGGDGTGSTTPAATPCRELTSDAQGWCLARSVTCSLAGVARSAGVRTLAGEASEPADVVWLNGVSPTESQVKSFNYPLSYTVWVNTVVGFANLPRPAERLGVCWGRKSLALSAGHQGGIVPIPPSCTDFSDTSCSDGGSYLNNVNACNDDAGHPLNFAQPQCAIDVSKELFITNPAVVDDPLRTGFSADAGTSGRGAFTIKTLFENLAPSAEQAPAMMRDLLNKFASEQDDNSLNPAHPNHTEVVDGVAALVDSWPTLNGAPGGPLDLEKAPFRLLAIVNRIDLANSSGVEPAGEGRFVFALTDNDAGAFPAGSASEFTFILEYTLPGATLGQWAQDWHALGQLNGPGTYGPEYRAGLEQVTQRFTGRDAVPSGPNGSALASLRTRDSFPTLRQFRLDDQQPAFVVERVANNPFADLSHPYANDTSYGGGGELLAFVVDHQAAILASNYNLPNKFLDIYSDTQPGQQFFRLDPSLVSNEVRHMFSLNSCSGCHMGETPANLFQVSTRAIGAESLLAPFLTGRARLQVNGDLAEANIVSGLVPPLRHFNELERRAAIMRDLVCP